MTAVPAQPGDEGVQFGQAVMDNGGHPGLEPPSLAVDHHLGELANSVAQDGELRAGIAESVQAVPVAWVQVGWVAQGPGGGLAERRRP